MDVRIQAIHFEASEKLVAFINKKAEKLLRRNATISTVDVTLKVVKPETAMNKQAIVKINDDLVADKTADSFEEAIDIALDALDRQLEKRKEKN